MWEKLALCYLIVVDVVFIYKIDLILEKLK